MHPTETRAAVAEDAVKGGMHIWDMRGVTQIMRVLWREQDRDCLGKL